MLVTFVLLLEALVLALLLGLLLSGRGSASGRGGERGLPVEVVSDVIHERGKMIAGLESLCDDTGLLAPLNECRSRRRVHAPKPDCEPCRVLERRIEVGLWMHGVGAVGCVG